MNTEKPHQQTNKNSTPRSKNCLAKILTRRDVTWHVPLPLFKSGLPSTISPWLTSVGPVWGVLSVSKNWTNRGRCAHHALRKNNLFPREEHSRRTNLSGLLRNYNNRGCENSFFLILQVNWHHYMEELLKKNENTYAKKGNFLDTPFFSLLTIEIWKQLSTPIFCNWNVYKFLYYIFRIIYVRNSTKSHDLLWQHEHTQRLQRRHCTRERIHLSSSNETLRTIVSRLKKL